MSPGGCTWLRGECNLDEVQRKASDLRYPNNQRLSQVPRRHTLVRNERDKPGVFFKQDGCGGRGDNLPLGRYWKNE
ncbi:hypothetical protein ACOMHN_065019 [Nucella lapillus]